MQHLQLVRDSIVPTLSLLLITITIGFSLVREPTTAQTIASLAPTETIRSWEYVDGFPERIAVFQSVFWEPRDTNSMRELIETTDLVRGKNVLEIGTGSGLVSLSCLREGATKVVATDVNPHAIKNACYNANLLGVAERFEARLVATSAPSAFEAIEANEKFDVIVSNPPWENAQPRTIGEYALYDRDFRLLRSILSEAGSHLNPGGRLLLAYGCRDAIKVLEELSTDSKLRTKRLDPRTLDALPDLFLPGMLVEVLPQTGRF